MKAVCFSLAFAVALGLALQVRAQAPPVPSPATLVEEVEVMARLPGPALWRVSTPTSQIWLLGVAAPLPRSFQWDDRRVAAALQGARELIVQPGASLGFGDIVGLMFDRGHLIHMPPGQTVRDGLPPELRARWEAAARAAGRDPARYDHLRPIVAAGVLTIDAETRNRMNSAGAQDQVEGLARKMHVKVRRLADYRGMPVIKGFAAAPEAVAQACIAQAANAALAMKDDAPKLAEAWAKGDLDTLRAGDDPSGDCADRVPEMAALADRVAADWASELKTALAQPGKVMVAVDLDSLTRKGGLLDQLKVDGLDVIGPAW